MHFTLVSLNDSKLKLKKIMVQQLEYIQRYYCNVIVHGGWTLWGIWGKCSATCGEGMRKRTRSCTNPRPERFGDHCFGDSTEVELCNTRSCAGKIYM
jgi:hypothetical protein